MSDTSAPQLEGRRILFCAPPFAGHLYPMLPLARAAKAAGARVEFMTGPAKLPLLSRLGFEATPFLASQPDALEKVANPPQKLGSNPLRLLDQLRQSLSLLLQEKPILQQLLAERRPDLVVADSVTMLPGILCEELCIPWISTVATPLAIESPTGTPVYLGGWRVPRTFLGRARDWLGRKLTRLVKRTMFALCRKEAALLGLPGVYRADGSEAVYSPHSLLGFGLTELEFPRQWPRAFRMIGPVLETPEAALVPPMRWPQGRSLVLVTFGTHLLWVKSTLLAQLQGLLRECPQLHFCISLGDAGRFSPEPLESGANWSVHGYIPYSRELSSFAAVIHHGGAGITYACIAAKRPSLVVPQDYDQFDFARRIEACGLGRSIKSLAAPAAAEALNDLLHARWQSSLEAMSAALERYRPEQTFLEEASRLLRPGYAARGS